MTKNTLIDYIVLESFPDFGKNTLIDYFFEIIDYISNLIDYKRS